MNLRKEKKGFTLVELLIVIVIISILFIVLIAKLDFTSNEARSTGLQSDLRAYSAAANSVALEYFGFSDDVELLAEHLNKFLDVELQVHVEGNNLETKAVDTWGKPYIITNMNPDGTRGEVSFISAGPDMEYFTEDDQVVRVLCNKNGDVDISYPMQQAHTHKFEENEIYTALKEAATCQKPAVYYFSCIVCKMNSQDIFEAGGVDPNNHTTSEKTYVMNDENSHTVESYCECGALVGSKSEQHTFNGSECVYCSQSEHEHTYTQMLSKPKFLATEATCLLPATYYYSCTCGTMGTETFEHGEPLGHNFNAEVVRPEYLANEGTCIVRAQYYRSCSRCGEAGTETFESGTLVPHIYSQESTLPGFLASSATCSNAAKYYYSCTCGTRGTETFEYGEALGHEYNDSSCIEAPICKRCGHENGVPLGHNPVFVGSQIVHSQCSRCELVLQDTHTYTNEIVTHSTCTEMGVTKYTCECGYFYTSKDIPANGHEFTTMALTNDYIKKPATCTTKAEYYYSCHCGVKGTESFEYGEANGHQYADATCTVAQTCNACGAALGTANGHTPVFVGSEQVHQECEVCHVVLSSSHAYTTSVEIPATCLDKGTTKYTCECGYSYTFQNIEKNPDNHAGSVVNGNSESVHSKYSCCGVKVSGEHDYTESVHSPATCTVKGVTKYTCTCGYSYTLQNIPEDPSRHYGTTIAGGTEDIHTKYSCCGAAASTEHSYTRTTVSAQTCILKGTSKYTCTCGYFYTVQDLPATGHHYDQQVATDKYFISEATCTVAAKYYYSCSCGAQGNEIFDYGTANGHSYSGATCTEAQTCSVCGHVSGGALGHTPVMGGTAQVHSECDVCGTILSTEHAFEESVVNVATCISKGKTKYTCDCGYTYTLEDVEKDPENHSGSIVNGGTAGICQKYSCCNTIESSEHNYTQTIPTAATCTTKGYTKYACTCGYYYTLQDVDINPSNHTGTVVNVGTQAIHTKYDCCDATVSTEHSYTSAITTAATCKAKGWTKYTCSCGYNYSEQNVAINPNNHIGTTQNGGTQGAHAVWSCCTNVVISTEHSYTKTTQTAATCTAKGTSKYTCSCGYWYTSQDIAALGHDMTKQRAEAKYLKDAATCTAKAKYYYSCQRCTEKGSTTFEYGSAKGHSYSAATCTVAQTCSVCGATSGGALGHSEAYGGTYGIHTYCSTCNVTLSTTHSYSSEITIAATCKVKGTTKYTCACGYNYTEQNVAINPNNHTGSASTTGGTATSHAVYSCCPSVTINANHSYTKTTQTAATCTTKGTSKYTCACGYSYTSQDIEKNPNNHASTEKVNGGTQAVHSKWKCCGTTFSTEHSYTKTTQTAATCTTKGTSKYTCACGYSYTAQDIAINSGNHTGSVVNVGTADVHQKYSCCNAAVGSHSYTKTTQTAATCTSKGTSKYTCSCTFSGYTLIPMWHRRWVYLSMILGSVK